MYSIEKYYLVNESISKHEINLGQEIYFVPENLDEAELSSEFIYSESVSEIRKIFKKENIPINYLTNDKPLLRSRKSADWYGPTLLFGISLLTESPYLIGISLNLISSYLYDFFKGINGSKSVRFEVIVEVNEEKEFKKIKYDGSIEGIAELEKVIKSLKL